MNVFAQCLHQIKIESSREKSKRENTLSLLHAHLICLGNLKVMHIIGVPINETLLLLLDTNRWQRKKQIKLKLKTNGLMYFNHSLFFIHILITLNQSVDSIQLYTMDFNSLSNKFNYFPISLAEHLKRVWAYDALYHSLWFDKNWCAALRIHANFVWQPTTKQPKHVFFIFFHIQRNSRKTHNHMIHIHVYP